MHLDLSQLFLPSFVKAHRITDKKVFECSRQSATTINKPGINLTDSGKSGPGNNTKRNAIFKYKKLICVCSKDKWLIHVPAAQYIDTAHFYVSVVLNLL